MFIGVNSKCAHQAPNTRAAKPRFSVGERSHFRRLIEPQRGSRRAGLRQAQLLHADKKSAHFTQRIRLI